MKTHQTLLTHTPLERIQTLLRLVRFSLQSFFYNTTRYRTVFWLIRSTQTQTALSVRSGSAKTYLDPHENHFHTTGIRQIQELPRGRIASLVQRHRNWEKGTESYDLPHFALYDLTWLGHEVYVVFIHSALCNPVPQSINQSFSGSIYRATEVLAPDTLIAGLWTIWRELNWDI